MIGTCHNVGNLENTGPSEISQDKQTTCDVAPFPGDVQKGQNLRRQEGEQQLPGSGGGNVEWIQIGTRVLAGVMNMYQNCFILSCIAGNPCIVHSKWVSFTVCKLHSNKVIFKEKIK